MFFSLGIHEGLICLFIVCETIFTIGESRAISHANDTDDSMHKKWLKSSPAKIFPYSETPSEKTTTTRAQRT